FCPATPPAGRRAWRTATMSRTGPPRPVPTSSSEPAPPPTASTIPISTGFMSARTAGSPEPAATGARSHDTTPSEPGGNGRSARHLPVDARLRVGRGPARRRGAVSFRRHPALHDPHRDEALRPLHVGCPECDAPVRLRRVPAARGHGLPPARARGALCDPPPDRGHAPHAYHARQRAHRAALCREPDARLRRQRLAVLRGALCHPQRRAALHL